MAHQPLRVIVVGCGNMAGKWIQSTLDAPDLELVGLVDLDRTCAQEKAGRFELPDSLVYDSLDTALEQARPEAVFDVTIPAAHHEVTLRALRAGCHVLGEKPMSESMSKAREMVAAAKEAGKVYAVTQTRRPNPNVLAATDFLRTGKLGRIEEVHCDFFLGPCFGGFRDEMDFPLLVDMAIHTFDNGRQLTGADPRRVYCHSFNPGRSWYRGDASAVAIFEMVGPEQEPVLFSYRGSWCAEGLSTSWNAGWRIIGSQGTLLWDGEDDIRAQVVKQDSASGFTREVVDVEVPRRTLEHTGHAYLIREFADCARNGKAPMAPCEDNIKSLAMVLSSLESACAQRPIDVTV